jgi:hypothetical protein
MDASRRQFLERAALAAAFALSATRLRAQTRPAGSTQVADLHLVNGRFHTMDAATRVVSQVWIRNGRFAGVGNNLSTQGNPRRIDLRGRTVIPGIVDAHNHIVLVGNRPGWHTPLEHVFTIPDCVAVLKARANGVPAGEMITCVGPIAAMQFAGNRLPNLTELDAVPRPVYLQAAQGGTRTNSEGKKWLEARGVMVAADGAITGQATGLALLALRKELLTAETRKRSAADALQYYSTLGITTHRDSGAFHADAPAPGIASENTYTMHEPFLALMREGRLDARLRLDFLHQDPPNANPPLPTLSDRLKNTFPFFGNDWIKTGGIGEFTGGGLDGLRAIARAGWRGEDHSLSLQNATQLIVARETVNTEIPIGSLRWIISHIPAFTPRIHRTDQALQRRLGRIHQAEALRGVRQGLPGDNASGVLVYRERTAGRLRRRRRFLERLLRQKPARLMGGRGAGNCAGRWRPGVHLLLRDLDRGSEHGGRSAKSLAATERVSATERTMADGGWVGGRRAVAHCHRENPESRALPDAGSCESLKCVLSTPSRTILKARSFTIHLGPNGEWSKRDPR